MLKKGRAAALVPFLALSLAASVLWAEAGSPTAAAPKSAAAATTISSSAEDAGDAEALDVVVLLDVSQSTLPYFEDVTDYVISSVVKDYLRRGDTFHLLSFGETAQAEIAQRVTDEDDVKAVLGRLYLLVPLAPYSDLVGALSYLNQYLADLPESRRKVVIMITDGVQNPPPTSPSFGASPEQVNSDIEAAASRIRANGWPVRIIQLPFPKPGEPGAPGAGSAEASGKSYLDAVASALGAEVSEYSKDDKGDIARKSLSLPSAEFPGPLGKRDYAFSFPVKITNGSDSPVGLELDRVRSGDADILSKKVFLTLGAGRSGTLSVPVLVPDTVPQGDTKLELRLHFANGVRVSPDVGVLELTLARSPVAAFLRSGARIALFVALLALGLAAILAIVIILRRMPRRTEAPIAAAVLASEAESGTGSTAAPAAAKVVVAAPEKAAAPGKAAAPAAGRVAAAAVGTAGPAPEQSVSKAGPGGERASELARAADSDAASSRLAKAAKEETAKSVDLLAEAARKDREESSARNVLVGIAKGRKRGERKLDEHEAEIESQTQAVAQQNKAETERGLSILETAAGRRQPAKAASAEQAQKAREAASSYASRVVKPGSIEVELIVAEQNPHIGSRNVHSISAGGSKTVGGGVSDFLIFLVKMPRACAELHFDGEKLAFVPLRPELFPELSGPVADCMGMEIPMISKGGYPLKLSFRRYEKPADKVNRLLHCLDTPGL